MKIVFYSSFSTKFNGNFLRHSFVPLIKENFERILQENSDIKIVIVAQKPALFLCDFKINSPVLSEKIQYLFLENSDSDFFAKKIAEFKPDLAVAVTSWTNPFDWLGLNDSLIAEKLEKSGIHTVCHSSKTQMICFDKNEMRHFLKKNDFNFAKSIFADKNLLNSEKNHEEIQENFYKNWILNEISKMKFPLVIKDVFGFSSYGCEVVKTFGEAKNYLLSKKNSTDKLIEEFLCGEQFGVEIWGNSKNFHISKPLMLSVNQYGITSPKQGIKTGPVLKKEFCFEELNRELFRLAKKLKLNGIAQVDLIFCEKKWFIVEVNSRVSGMTEAVASMENKNIQEVFVEIAKNEFLEKGNSFILDFKLPVLDEKQMKNLKKIPYVDFVSQTKNLAAKQNRECGYCEIVIKAKTSVELRQNFLDFCKNNSCLIEENFKIQAENLMQKSFF